MRIFTTRNVLSFILLLFLIMVFWTLMAGMTNVSEHAADEQLQTMKAMAMRACIQCYALEGSFPPSLEHLQNYGFVIDESRYHYMYTIAGANIMPNLEIIKK